MTTPYGYDRVPIESQEARWERLRQRVMVLDGFPEQEPAIADELVRVGMQRVREKAELACMMIDGHRDGLIPWSHMMGVVDAAVRDMASTSHQCGLDDIPELDRTIGVACENVHFAGACKGYLAEHLDDLGESFNDVARSVDAVGSDSVEACSERVLTAMREVPDQVRMQVAMRSCIEHMAEGGQMGPGLGLRESMGMPRDEGDAWRSVVMVDGRTHDAKAWFEGAKHDTVTRGTVGGLEWDMRAVNDLVEDARRSVALDSYEGVALGDAQRVGRDMGDIAGRFAVGAIRENYDVVVDTLVRRCSLEDQVSSEAVERRRYVEGLNRTFMNTMRSDVDDPWVKADLMQRIGEASFDLPFNRAVPPLPMDDAEAVETIRVLDRSIQQDCGVTGTRRRLGDECINARHAVETVDTMGKGGTAAAIMCLATRRRSDSIYYAGDTRVGKLVGDAFAQGRDLSEITRVLEAIDDIGKRTPNNLEQAMDRLQGVSRDVSGRRMPSPSVMPSEAPDSSRGSEVSSGRRMPSPSVMPPKKPSSPRGPEAER